MTRTFSRTGNVVVCDAGFSVEWVWRDRLIYREGSYELVIDGEILMGPHWFTFDRTSVKNWRPPHFRELIDDAKRDTIIDNVVAAYRSVGQELEVTWHGYPRAMVPHAGATAPQDGTPLRALMRKASGDETTLFLVSWRDEQRSWVTALGRPLGAGWCMEAWGSAGE